MRIPDEVLQEIRARVSIVDVVARHVALKRSGKNWKGLCPFHGEKTPSFVVSEERGTYHCFGCGAGGSVFRFLMEAEGRTFLEAVQDLARTAGVSITLGPEDDRHREQRERRAALLDLLELAARYYRHQLAEGRAGGRARAYLERRRIPPETAAAFGIGCAPAGWNHLARYLERKGVDLSLAEEAGLVAARASGGHYDRLRDRLVFPIADAAGRVVSFGGRVLGEGEPKYLNGPDSPVFRKGELLYGLHQAGEGLRRERRAVLVEGYLDVISLHARGFTTALATLGTALTAEHVQALRRRVDDVVLLYDGDEAGRKAAFRGLELFLGEGFPCRGVLLPPEHDPDSFVLEGGDLRGLLDGAHPLLDLFVEEVLSRSDLGSVEGRLEVVAALTPKLEAVTDPLARDLYVARVAEAVGVEENLLRGRLRVGRTGARAEEEARESSPAEDPLELSVLACLLHEPEARASFRESGASGWLRPGPAREAALFLAAQPGGAEELRADEAPEPARRLLTQLLVAEEAPRPPYALLEARLKLRNLDSQAARLLGEIRRAEAAGNGEEVLRLMGEKRALDDARLTCKRAASGRIDP